MNIFVLSSRALCSTVSWDPVFELENIIVRTCNAQLLIPSARDVIQWSSGLNPLADRIIRKAVLKQNFGIAFLRKMRYHVTDPHS